MFSVAYARLFAKSTKAADSDTGDTDVKRSCGKITLVSGGSDTDGVCS